MKIPIIDLPNDMIDMETGSVIIIRNIRWTYDLTDMGCAQNPYICVDVGTRSDSPWVWTNDREVITDCLLVATCESK